MPNSHFAEVSTTEQYIPGGVNCQSINCHTTKHASAEKFNLFPNFIIINLIITMLENTVESFYESLFVLLTDQTTCGNGLILKKHAENLQTHGDFSFPNSSKSWIEYIGKPSSACKDATLLQVIGKTPEHIVEESRKWKLQVQKVKEGKGRVYLFLHRPSAISIGIAAGFQNAALVSKKLQEQCFFVKIDPLCVKSNCLTYLRVKYLSRVIDNLCLLFLKQEQRPELLVTYKSSTTCAGIKILCSSVLSAKTSKKETEVNADDFIRSRQDEMTLIAQHKYGVRVMTDSKWQAFIAHLGESAAAFELLQIKPTSVVKVNCDNMAGGNSKGAAFILYNCARLETLIKTFEERVKQGMYPPLPDLSQVDFTLLNQEDEWNLIFNYIMGFPSMLDSCLEIKDNKWEFRPHFICSFLCSMVRVFSQYYRKTRILVEARQHLLPAVYARLHMLRILNDTLKACLKILNIKSVSQM